MALVKALAILFSLLFPGILAHGGLKGYIIGDQEYVGYDAYLPPEGQMTIARPWTSVDPILSPHDHNLACNNDGGATRGGGQISALIHAGEPITAIWGYWMHPFGPGMVYMARCPGSCTSANSTELKWFKIEETGLVYGSILDGKWASGLVVDTGLYHATIPAALADGEYLIRNELIALHAISGGAQFYAECGQLIVTGGGGKLPPPSYLVTFPGAYKGDEPGLNIDVYAPGAENITTYVMPGPPLWDGQDF